MIKVLYLHAAQAYCGLKEMVPIPMFWSMMFSLKNKKICFSLNYFSQRGSKTPLTPLFLDCVLYCIKILNKEVTN